MSYILIRMNIEILKSVGLTEIEGKLYLSLLELGSSNATELSHKSRIHRTNIYDSLNRLIEKGLVSYIEKNGKKVFEAADPKKLREIIKEKEQELERALPELDSLFKLDKKRNNVRIFEGKEGIRTIFDDFITVQGEILMYGVPSKSVEVLKYFLPHYHKERIKKKISTRAIFNHDAKNRMGIINEMKFAKAKYLPGKNKSPTSTNIYGDKIAIILWSETPLIIQIESKEIAESYRNYFELMWQNSKT